MKSQNLGSFAQWLWATCSHAYFCHKALSYWCWPKGSDVVWLGSYLLSWSSSVYPAMHWRIWQTTVSSSLTSSCADSTLTTRRCVLFDSYTTPLTISVSQRLYHTCGTHYLLWYDNVTVSESSNGCWRHICLGTMALCDSLVKSAV